jgi:alkylation response protein AidB-like acyl-CoA dehydrogenase
MSASRTSPHAFDGLCRQVRQFLSQQRAAETFAPRVDSWGGSWNPGFSRALAGRGWIGMTIPAEYGGHGRSFLERFVVTEELLAAGAPVSAHWVADRQAAPSLLRYGTERQKRHYLPPIAAGEMYWAIGMSEAQSGSDLASVRTRATRAENGWVLDGTKLWTSGAHHAHMFFVLARSEPLDAAHRHNGLSQFIVPLTAPGITISPIEDMSGRPHFNEVHLDSVFVPDDHVLGTIGSGWEQVTSELGYERSGPERCLSTFSLLSAAVQDARGGGLPDDARLGAAIARIFALHSMSFAVAEILERKEEKAAGAAAAVVKLLGTGLEGEIVDQLTEPGTRGRGAGYDGMLRDALMVRPGFTIRGGTTEILRDIIARGIGLR